ncbi:hypothetical protein ACWGB8_22550 [Kitasatospora sp. NPDC054939]
MSSTTPAPERAPRDARAGEPVRAVPQGEQGSPAVAPGAPMRALLAACAAAEAVSTPPTRSPEEPAHRTPRAA